MGEFPLIELVADLVGRGEKDAPASSAGGRLLIGIGDDASLWHCRNTFELATTDTLVAGVHFTVPEATWHELGWKALAINLSDIAAMGGLPRYCLVTLGLTAETAVEEVLQFYRGLLELAEPWGVVVAGGDFVASPVLTITVAVVGEAPTALDGSPQVLRRSAAQVGEAIAVTGHLGSSAGGCRLLSQKLSFDRETATWLRRAHLQPEPRLAEGRALVEAGIRAAIDVSDGLVDDLAKLCRASGVGARINLEAIPVHPKLQAAFPQDWREMALSGGEDYELLFAAPRETVADVARRVRVPITVIGQVMPGQGVTVVDERDEALSIGKGGWDHFRAQR